MTTFYSPIDAIAPCHRAKPKAADFPASIAAVDAELDKLLADDHLPQAGLQRVYALFDWRDTLRTGGSASHQAAPGAELLPPVIGVAVVWTDVYRPAEGEDQTRRREYDMNAFNDAPELAAAGKIETRIDHDRVCRGKLSLYLDYIGLIAKFEGDPSCENARELVRAAEAAELWGMSFEGDAIRESQLAVLEMSGYSWKVNREFDLREITFCLDTEPRNRRTCAGLMTKLSRIVQKNPYDQVRNRLIELAQGAELYRPGR